jgi:SH3-like domain-containing protein
MKSTIAVLAFALALSLTSLLFAQSGNTQVRFVHVLSGAGAVDVYINNIPAVVGLDYGQASTYLTVPAGDHQVAVTASGTTTPLWQQPFAATDDSAFTMVVSSTSPLQFFAYQDDLSSLGLGETRITAIHAIPDAPAVDVVLEDGRAVIAGLGYNQPYGTLDLPSLAYPLAIVPTGASIGEAVIPVTPFALNAGSSYAVVAYGSLASPQVLVLSAPVASEAGSGFARLVHGVASAPAVDIYLNEVLVAPSLAFGGDTSFIALPAGDYTAVIREAGTSNDIASAQVVLEAGDYVTGIALVADGEVVIQPVVDEVSAVDSAAPAFTIVNGLLDSSSDLSLVNTDDNTTLIEAVAAGASETTALRPAAPVLEVALSDSSAPPFNLAAGTIYGGTYYTAIVVEGTDGPELLLLSPVSLSQSLGSAPGSLLAAAPPEVAAQPTATVIPAIDATAVPQVVQPTAPPAATPLPPGPTARVILDPGANLQLRQYPNRNAFSLGLAPSGSVLQVIGRAGDPAPAIGAPTIDPSITPTTDPISLIPPEQDLVASDTWLNVDYLTPDGGVINAWVNAQFLDVRDVRGRRQRLADLPTVPSNQPGEARDTAVAPPPLPSEIIVATVVGLNEGVNLQVRRIPSTNGESLALVPVSGEMELIGIGETGEWAFVRYLTPEGGAVTGWVSASFLTYSFRGNAVTLEVMSEQGRLSVIPDDRRGEVGAGVSGPVAPTRDPLRNVVVGTVSLNQGANLHLRRNPDANSESLALMTSDTQVVVNGRTDTGEWVQIEFEGQVGWTFSRYLTLTFNGVPFNLTEVPVVLTTLPLNVTPTPGS